MTTPNSPQKTGAQSRRSLSYNDAAGSRGKLRRQERARAKMEKRHGIVRVDPEIEVPKP